MRWPAASATPSASERPRRLGDVEPDYLAVVDPDTLEQLSAVNGRVLVAVAARVGPTRLIDNTLINTEVATPVS